MQNTQTSVHCGNYYTFGVKRVLDKLTTLGIDVPIEALKPAWIDGEPAGHGFTNLELAVLEWFTDRDYTQAQALIHFRQPIHDWYAIYSLGDDLYLPDEITHGMLSPGLEEALRAVADACERSGDELDQCITEDSSLLVSINGLNTLRIEPIVIEPFNLAVRDRVRSTFKGVRYMDQPAIMSSADRLPGFKSAIADRESRHGHQDVGFLLGFPANWSLAMRTALKQVGIDVKLSQAQELAAVFFGASNWHQLAKHQDEPNDNTAPVCVSIETNGSWCHTFYSTPEEALFATGRAIESYPVPTVIDSISLDQSQERVVVFVRTQSAVEAVAPNDLFAVVPTCIECGIDDYVDLDWGISEECMDTVRDLLAGLRFGINRERK